MQDSHRPRQKRISVYDIGQGAEKLMKMAFAEVRNLDEALFELLSSSPDKQRVSVAKFLKAITSTGIRQGDPRMQATFDNIINVQYGVAREWCLNESLSVDRETFKQLIKDNIVLIGRAFRKELVIPDFTSFCKEIDLIYEICEQTINGSVCTIIPQLMRTDPSSWAVSICTIDGQRYSRGNVNSKFTLQSISKPLMYALAVQELGAKNVHQYVGLEHSGRNDTEVFLGSNNKPHNPMILSGSLVICSLLGQQLPLSDKFEFVMEQLRELAGGEFVGFNNAAFLSRRQTAYQHYALGYYLKEQSCFPPSMQSLQDLLDFHFQMTSVEATTESLAVIAATFASGGVCPLSGRRSLKSEAVRNTQALMHSCGMGPYSGQFAFQVGLPAKSSESGVIFLIVPGVMGICCWSPLINDLHVSPRALRFCEELVNVFAFHHYETPTRTLSAGSGGKLDVRQHNQNANQALEVVNLIFAASSGDISALERFFLTGINMSLADYDGRTALHLAAAEGKLNAVQFLVEKSHVDTHVRDRWGHTPLSEAKRFGQTDVVNYLLGVEQRRQQAKATTKTKTMNKLVEEVEKCFSDIIQANLLAEPANWK